MANCVKELLGRITLFEAPSLEYWQMCFGKTPGEGGKSKSLENRKNVLKEFICFLDGDSDEFDAPGEFSLCGYVFGRIDFYDGDRVVTSPVKRIRRAKDDRDQLVAETHSGSRYHIRLTGCTRFMLRMIEDCLNDNLKERRWAYVAPEWQKSNLL